MANDLIRHIRSFEAEHRLKPANIKTLSNGTLEITIDKTVLYQTTEEKGPGFISQAHRWLRDHDDSFNAQAHAAYLTENLHVPCRVRRRYKKLPIPYFDVPIPFFASSGTRVRDYTNLATQKVKVTLTFNVDDSSAGVINTIIQASMLSQSLPLVNPLPSAARRKSWNPIKWMLSFLSKLIPRGAAYWINKFLPNKFIKASRPYEWGTQFSEIQLNPGFCNAGMLAPVASTGAICAGLADLFCCSGRLLSNSVNIDSAGARGKEDPDCNAWSQVGVKTPQYTFGEGQIYSSRHSLFAQSTTKLVCSPKSLDINEAIIAAGVPLSSNGRYREI